MVVFAVIVFAFIVLTFLCRLYQYREHGKSTLPLKQQRKGDHNGKDKGQNNEVGQQGFFDARNSFWY